jgi:hypothetical protein
MTPETAGCEPELVTGWVDDALDAAAAERIAAHVSGCAPCRAQADAERHLRARLRAEVPLVTPAPSLAPRVRSRLRQRPALPWSRVLLPLAAPVLLAFGWARSTPSFLAWELARDHQHCFGRTTLPAKVWTSDAEVARGWFEDQGTRTPWLPDEAGRVQLVGARYCPLPGLSKVAHLYYAGEEGQVSVFVVDRPLLLKDEAIRLVDAHHVVIRRKGGTVLAIVAPEKKDLEQLQDALDTTFARLASR